MSKYHRILELPPNASKDEVKTAYRRLARKYHPDVNRSPEAQQKFQMIEEAYRMIRSGKAKRVSSDRRAAYAQAKQAQEERRKEAYRERVRRARKFAKRIQEQREKNFVETVRRFVTTMIILIVSLSSYYSFEQIYPTIKIQQNTATTWGVIYDASTRNARYSFEVDGKEYKGSMYLRKAFTEIVTPNGMPLENGQYFVVEYNAQHPQYNRLNFNEYASSVSDRYFEMTFRKMRVAPKFSIYNDAQLACLISEVYRRKGTDGLATIYFFSEPAIENVKYNKFTYNQFKKSETFQSIHTHCLQTRGE